MPCEIPHHSIRVVCVDGVPVQLAPDDPRWGELVNGEINTKVTVPVPGVPVTVAGVAVARPAAPVVHALPATGSGLVTVFVALAFIAAGKGMQRAARALERRQGT